MRHKGGGFPDLFGEPFGGDFFLQMFLDKFFEFFGPGFIAVAHQFAGNDVFAQIFEEMTDVASAFHRVFGKRRDSFMGEEIRMHDEKEAEKLLRLGLTHCDLAEGDLSVLKKGDDRKKAIAWYIRRNTSVKTEWIATRLKMGTTSNFSRYIRAVEESKEGLLLELRTKMTV